MDPFARFGPISGPRLCWMLIPLVVATSCRVAEPPPAVKQVEVPIRSEFAAAPTQAAGIADNWLETFRDPRLNGLVQEALRNNQDLRLAAARREEAAARTAKAGARLVPRLDAGGGVSEGSGGEKQQIGLQIQWEADVWGRLRGSRAAAEMDRAVVEADYEFARQSLAAAVAEAWLVAIGNELQRRIDTATLASLSETERVVRAKVKSGQSRPLDLDLATANAAQAREALERTRGSCLESRRSLEVLLGRYPAAEIELAQALPLFPGTTPAGLPAQLLERRPDLVAADRNVAAAFYRVGAAKAARLPQVTLSASLGSLLNPSDAIWNIGGNLLGPLFDGGERQADVAITEARQKQALAQFVKAALGAFAEVETALSNEQILARREAELVAAQKRLADAKARATRRYSSGDLSIFDLSQVQGQHSSAQSSLLRVHLERLKQRVKLHLALGGSFDERPTASVAGTSAN